MPSFPHLAVSAGKVTDGGTRLAQTIRFLWYFAGAMAGLIADWLTWLILVTGGMPPVGAQAAGKAVGALAAFVLHGRITFRDSPPSRGRALRFVLAVLFGWACGVAVFAALLSLVPTGTDGLSQGIGAILAKVASDGITFFLGWFVMRRFVFPPAAPAEKRL